MTLPSSRALSPRSVAAAVLRRVIEDDAFAAAALSSELDRHVQLTPRDRAAATDLVYGALRTARYLDGRLARLSPGLALDPPLRALLWVAGYELCFRPMAPAPIVVSDTVEISKGIQSRASGLVNALLRKLLADLAVAPAPPLLDAFVAGTPRWLRRALERSLGPGEADRFLAAGPLPPPIGLRVRRGDRDAWIARLREERPEASFDPSPLTTSAIRCLGGGDPRRWSGVVDGSLIVQEEGSQLIGEALGVQPGDRVLDACAGRGNKTFLLADALARRPAPSADAPGADAPSTDLPGTDAPSADAPGTDPLGADSPGTNPLGTDAPGTNPAGADPRSADAPDAGGYVDAADLHGAKLERLQDEALRLGVQVGRCYEIDASVGRGAIEEGGYDRVLIDAPCSGIGTLRRRPEIILRRAEASVAELQTLQRAILHTIAPAVKPGGTLIYAVCSVLVEECEEVIRDLPGFDLLSVRRLLPHREGSDGYAFATLRAHG